MSKFITHHNNKYELINLDLIEHIYAMTTDEDAPIEDSDGLFTLMLDAPWYTEGETVQHVEKFSSIKELEGRLEVLQRISLYQ